MGYALYDTPMGDAGYCVDDICHEDDCTTDIDRGVGYLCGSTPGEVDEYGCGKWFCEMHLWVPPDEVEIIGGGLCGSCMHRHGWLTQDEEEQRWLEEMEN